MSRDLASAASHLEVVPAVEPPLKPFSPITLEEFLQKDFPPRENLLSPWLPAKGLAMVFAPRGVGKTHFALGVAYAVASGGSYLKWRADRPHKVLLLDGEMPAIALQERLAEIVRASTKQPPPGYINLLPYDLCENGAPDLSTKDGQEALEPLIGDAELIVVDNISTICRSGKENESESWGTIQGWALSQRRKGRTVLFVHHAGKGGEQRGTSKREDVMDTIIKLSNPGDYEASEGARFIVTFTKSRGIHGADVEGFEARLNDGFWAVAEVEDICRAEVLELKSEGMSVRDIAAKVGLSKSKVQRIIARES